MRSNNANFDEKNSANSKSPRFVIEIDFSDDETDLNYFTSHSDIPTVTPVIHGVLKNTSSISQKLMPERANSSIGSLSFDLLDASKAITALFNTKRVNRQVLFGKRVRLYLGYEGLAWTDYRLEQTQFIDKKIKYKNGIYKMSCKDSQDPMNKPILEPLETRLSVALSDTETNVQVYNTAGFELVARDSDHIDAPNTDCTYCEISDNGKKEYCRITAVGNSFTVDRGVLGSTAQGWALPAEASDEKGPKVKELIFVHMKSLKLAYALMTGELLNQTNKTLPAHWHLGMDTALLNQAHFENQDDFTAYSLELKKTNAKKLLESEIMLPNARYFRVNGQGKLDLKRLFAINKESSPIFTLDESNIIKYSDLEFDSSDTSNKFSIDWSYDPFPKKPEYRRRSTFVFADSVTDYGEKLKSFKFRLINGVTATTTTLQNTINSFADRYAGEGARLKLTTFAKNNNLEVGDVVIVKHAGIQDFNIGTSINRSMQIINVKVNQQKGTVDLDLFGSTFTPEPLADGSLNVMNNSFYTATGTVLPNVSGGQLTSNTTLVGSADHNNSVWYVDGDLTINAGVTLTISDNAQLRVRGHLTVLGDINGVGNGRVSGGGFIGSTIGGNARVRVIGDSGEGEDYFVQGSTINGQYEAFPSVTLDNPDGLSIAGIPTDLRGSVGAVGGTSSYTDEFGTITTAAGGSGNDSGSALVIICRGMSVTGAGAINVSGVAGNVGNTNGFAEGGYGSYSSPGGFLVLIDGGLSSVPNLTGRVTALSSNPSPVTPTIGFDIKQNASRIQFIPQARVPVEDDPINDTTTTLYTWIKFADDAAGAGLTDDPTGKAYLGLAVNQTAQAEGTNAAVYTWSKILGDDGNDGVGQDGADGQTTYTWVKYANDGVGAGLTNDPAGKDYIGLAFNKTTATESTVAADYSWSLYVGSNGVAGVNGAAGIDGIDGTNGTDGSDGVSGADALASLPIPFSPGLLGGSGDFIFTLDMLAGGSVNVGEVRIQGSKFQHPDGAERALQADKTLNTSFGEGLAGRFFLMWTDEVATTRFPARTGPGTVDNVVAIKDVSGVWKVMDNGSTTHDLTITATDCILAVIEAETATSGLTGLVPFVSGSAGLDGSNGVDGTNGQDGLDGLQGADGTNGIAGTNGTNGTSSYFHIAYADSDTGAGFSQSSAGKDYIGTYVDSLATDAASGSGLWNWQLVAGQDGANGSNGIPGVDGSNGLTSYLHIAYANNSTGSSGFSTTNSTDKFYIGQYTDFALADSNTAGDYSWTLIRGADGADGQDGSDGADGLGADPILNSTNNPITGLTHVSVGNGVLVTWNLNEDSGSGTNGNNPPTGNVTHSLRRDGTVIDTATAAKLIESEPGFELWSAFTGTRTYLDTPGVGSTAYTVTSNENSSDPITYSGAISTREEQ